MQVPSVLQVITIVISSSRVAISYYWQAIFNSMSYFHTYLLWISLFYFAGPIPKTRHNGWHIIDSHSSTLLHLRHKLA